MEKHADIGTHRLVPTSKNTNVLSEIHAVSSILKRNEIKCNVIGQEILSQPKKRRRKKDKKNEPPKRRRKQMPKRLLLQLRLPPLPLPLLRRETSKAV